MQAVSRTDTPAGRRTAPATLLLALMALLTGTLPALAADGNSTATITASFGDSCSDFDAHSSKDISHVGIHYADGTVVKDETIDVPDFSIEGGDEIDVAIVKSGASKQQFDCDIAPITACADGLDNDGNGVADYPEDPGCTSPDDDEELGADNGDGLD